MAFLYIYISFIMLSFLGALFRMDDSKEKDIFIQLVAATIAHILWTSLLFWGIYFGIKAFMIGFY